MSVAIDDFNEIRCSPLLATYQVLGSFPGSYLSGIQVNATSVKGDEILTKVDNVFDIDPGFFWDMGSLPPSTGLVRKK